MRSVKKDCFAYRNNGVSEYCNAIKGLYCRDGKCVFYKPKEKRCNGCPHKKTPTKLCRDCSNLQLS